MGRGVLRGGPGNQRNLEGVPGCGWDEERVERVLREAKEEMRDARVYWAIDIFCFVGKKKI